MASTDNTIDKKRLAAERDALVGKIAAGLAHDLNGPIGIVLGFNDLSREVIGSSDGESLGPDQIAKISEYLDLIDGAAKRARTLTQEIWEFAKSNPGQTSEVDLQGELELAARLAAPALRNAGIETPQQPEDNAEGADQAESISVTGDRAMCSQVFVGLMLEAPSALPSGGQIGWTISSGEEQTVLVSIEARTWEGSAGSLWTVPQQSRDAMAAQGGSVESASEAGRVMVTLPVT